MNIQNISPSQEAGCPIALIKSKLVVLTFLFISGLLFFFAGCATAPPPQNDKVEQIQKELKAAQKKLEEVYHRVSLIQFMVDSHERSIKDMEKAQMAKAGKTGPKGDNRSDSLKHQLANTKIDPHPKKKAIENSAPKKLNIDNAEKSSVLLKQSAQGLYQQALAAYNQNDFYRAEASFRSLLKANPHNDLADNALYWAGECLYAEKRYTDAIQTFKRVLSDFPEGGKVPDALLKVGYSYISIGENDNARLFLKQVIKKFPFSSAGVKAEKMLNRIQ